MNYLPIGLGVQGKRILVVGGGKVAVQKLATLVHYADDILVVAPEIQEAVRRFPVKCLERTFGEDLLEGVFLVYACTDDREVNRTIGEAARARGVPANVADDPQGCDFISPAVYREGDMSVAVTSNATDARRSVAWRNAISRLAEGGAFPETSKPIPPASKKADVAGKVFLVGYGPGDPELLTFKADRVLREADSIFYDDLLNPEILRKYKGRAVYVGKRENQHSQEQDSINEELAKSALAGEKVVRLKGGDPAIFGRAGEELAHLTSQGIEVEIVPGITAASAAAASAGVSLTHRGVSSEVVLRTGRGAVEGEKACEGKTLVYYMAASRLMEIVSELMAEGWPPSTPVVLTRNASLPHEKVLSTTLGEVSPEGWDSPLVLIVGNATVSGGIKIKDHPT